MSLRSRWNRWRRRRRAAQNSGLPLREFVYLDDISVMSLLASRIGAVPTEYTDSESRTSSSRVGGGFGASAAVLRSDVSSELQDSRSSATQVVRKSLIQSAFKELREYEDESLVLRLPRGRDRPPEVRSPAALLKASGELGHWVRPASALRRGALVEIDVELDADEIFRVSATMSTLLRFVDLIPELAEITDAASLRHVVTANQLLDQLLVGTHPAPRERAPLSARHGARRRSRGAYGSAVADPVR